MMQRRRLKILICSPLVLIITACSFSAGNSQSAVSVSESSVAAAPTAGQLQRKQRSEEQLQVIGVPINPALGVLPAEKDVRLRDETEVEARALCLIIVATKTQDVTEQLIDTIVKQYDLAECFTPLERAFMESAEPGPDQLISARWRYESARTLLWALGLFDTLAPPDEMTFVPAMVRIMTSMTSESFREATSLRPTAEILDAADMTYRFHSATHDARKNFQPPPGKVIESVVYEREYALNWLIGYPDEAWDDLGNEAESAE